MLVFLTEFKSSDCFFYPFTTYSLLHFYVPLGLTSNNSTYSPQGARVCFVWFSV